MYIPLQYQVSEYDCVPTSFINAVSFLFERSEIPPMVIRHIYMYSLDTVGRDGRFGSAGTSKHAVRLLGAWLSSYKYKRFSVNTLFIQAESVRFHHKSKIVTCLRDGGVVLCKIYLNGRQEHYLMLMGIEEGWVLCFDPYCRKSIKGLRNKVEIINEDKMHAPNLKINIQWIEKDDDRLRFCLGPVIKRESLLIWREKP